MRQDIEAFLADWAQHYPPRSRKSDTQSLLEEIVPKITHLRKLGYSWPQLAAMFDKAGLTDTNGRPMKAETLRRKAVRAGYREPASGDPQTSSIYAEPDGTEPSGSKRAGHAAPAAGSSRVAPPPAKKAKVARSGVFTTVRQKSQPQRLEENLTPYSTEDIIQDANTDEAETEGGT